MERAALERRLQRTEAVGEQIYAAVQRLEEQVGRVEQQAIRTNGRVTAIELWKAGIDGFVKGTSGSWHVFLGLGGLLVGIGSLVTAVVVIVG